VNANEDLIQIMDYKAEYSSINSARTFVDKLYQKITILENMPHIGKSSEKMLDVRRILVDSNYALYYHINQDELVVSLLAIFDLRQNPNKNPFE
jgi:plasmid stabilization system protein ParE